MPLPLAASLRPVWLCLTSLRRHEQVEVARALELEAVFELEAAARAVATKEEEQAPADVAPHDVFETAKMAMAGAAAAARAEAAEAKLEDVQRELSQLSAGLGLEGLSADRPVCSTK